MNKINVNRGDVFGRLSVIREVETIKRRRRFLCRCSCGTEKVFLFEHLRSGRTKSCGCFREDIRPSLRRTHGMFGTPIYSAWSGMIQRCVNPKCSSFDNYGGRGISVCDEWMSFEDFYLWAKTSGYKKGLTIERVDVNGNYEPSNCTFIPKSAQAKNTRRSVYYEIRGKKKILSDWSKECNVPLSALHHRLAKGMSIQEATSRPLDYSRHPKQRATQCLK